MHIVTMSEMIDTPAVSQNTQPVLRKQTQRDTVHNMLCAKGYIVKVLGLAVDFQY